MFQSHKKVMKHVREEVSLVFKKRKKEQVEAPTFISLL